MAGDNKVRGKLAGNQNEGRQQMDRAGRAAEAGGGGPEAFGSGGAEGDRVTGETPAKISGGNERGGGAARHSDR